jgi:hypothetical protein
VIDHDYLLTFCIALAIWWIAGSYAGMVAAEKRGYSSWNWFLSGIFCGPMLAALLPIANPEQAPSREEVPAPSSLSIRQ